MKSLYLGYINTVTVLVLFLIVNYVMVCNESFVFLFIPFCSNHPHFMLYRLHSFFHNLFVEVRNV